MSTIESLQQRLELEYLAPLTELSPSVPITSAMTSVSTTFTLKDGVLSPDELALIGPGIRLELEKEIVFVYDFDESTRTVDVSLGRGADGSERSAHDANALVRFPLRWPRYIQEQAIRDAVESMSPSLFVVKEIRVPTDALGHIGLPLNTVSIVEVMVTDGSRWLPVEADLFQTSGYDSSVAGMQLETRTPNTMARVRYGIAPSVPSDSTEELDIPSKWERCVLVDAAIGLMSGLDIDAVSQEYLSESLRLERFPVRSGESIVRSLIQLREYLWKRLMDEQNALNPPRIRQVETVVLD